MCFKFICYIKPDLDSLGNIFTYSPQIRYSNYKDLSFNKHGDGSFCRFRLPDLLSTSGVYAIKIENKIMYIGESSNFSKRFSSSGYGLISPRNCFIGGQSTNCKVNKRILQFSKLGKKISLLFMDSDNRIVKEKELINKYNPPWNE